MKKMLHERMASALAHRKALDPKPSKVNKAALARACQVSAPSVNDWFSGKTKQLKHETAVRAANYLHVRVEWLTAGIGPMTIREGNPQHLSQAQSLSLAGAKLLPTKYLWEEMMNIEENKLPDEFRLMIGEASLQQIVPMGTVVTFNRLKKPQPGEGILVQDGSGARHFRRYRELGSGRWEAFSMNVAYPNLRSDENSLTLLAVYAGREDSLVGL